MTNYTRRKILHTGLAGLMAGSFERAVAQPVSWPRGTVRLVIAFPPGGGIDASSRLVADGLRAVWAGAATPVVENKPGANTVIAAQTVLSAPRDGSAFLITIPTTFYLPHLMKKPPFDPAQELVPVGPVAVNQLVLVANAAAGIKTVADLRRATGRKLSFGTNGVGTTAHFLQMQLATTTGADILHVPYKGSGEAIAAVLSGDVTFLLAGGAQFQAHIDAGKLVPIAVTGTRRSPFMPQVPTLAEQGITSFELPLWFGVFAAKGTPDAIVQKMSADLRTALRAPDVVAKLAREYQEPGNMSPAEFQDLVRRDVAVGEQKIKAAGLNAD